MKKKTNQKANNQPYQIEVQYAADKQQAPQAADFQTWAKAALQHHVKEAELTIRIVSIDEMTQLNTTFRNKQGPTNVLSFPAPDDIQEEMNLLGDIIICSDVVNNEAKEQHKDPKAHWAHMTVHGVFHLLGFDHEKDDEAIVMETQETRVLQTLGYPDPYQLGESVKHE